MSTAIQLEALTPRKVSARVRHKTLSPNITGGRVHCSSCSADTGHGTTNVLEWKSGRRVWCSHCDGNVLAKPIFFSAGFYIDLVNNTKVTPKLVKRSDVKASAGQEDRCSSCTCRNSMGHYLNCKKTNNSIAIDNIIFLIDDSGSMMNIAPNVVDMFNLQLETIANDAKTTGRKTFISLYTFSSVLNKVVIDSAKIDDVKKMAYQSFNPRGYTTALRDSILTLVSQKLNQNSHGSNLMFVLTDGMDNASISTTSALREVLNKAIGTDRWTLGVLCPPNSKEIIANNLGIDESNIREWETTKVGIQQAAVATAKAYGVFSAARSLGKSAVKKQLFEADLSKIKASALKKFDDVSSDFKHWKVNAESTIKDFVEGHSVTYSIGKAYYELTKREEVQDYKNICIKDKKTGKIHSGTANELRGLLGFPQGETIKLEPGNMATYSIFIQSTSTNRKLVRGTTVLYKK